MFDIGFAELIIIGVVSLIVIGPERLPGAIRTTSAWLNRIRRGFNDIKHEVQQELHNDKVMQDLKTLRDTGQALQKETQALSSDLGSSLAAPKTLDLESLSPKKNPEHSDKPGPAPVTDMDASPKDDTGSQKGKSDD